MYEDKANAVKYVNIILKNTLSMNSVSGQNVNPSIIQIHSINLLIIWYPLYGTFTFIYICEVENQMRFTNDFFKKNPF